MIILATLAIATCHVSPQPAPPTEPLASAWFRVYKKDYVWSSQEPRERSSHESQAASLLSSAAAVILGDGSPTSPGPLPVYNGAANCIQALRGQFRTRVCTWVWTGDELLCIGGLTKGNDVFNAVFAAVTETIKKQSQKVSADAELSERLYHALIAALPTMPEPVGQAEKRLSDIISAGRMPDDTIFDDLVDKCQEPSDDRVAKAYICRAWLEASKLVLDFAKRLDPLEARAMPVRARAMAALAKAWSPESWPLTISKNDLDDEAYNAPPINWQDMQRSRQESYCVAATQRHPVKRTDGYEAVRSFVQDSFDCAAMAGIKDQDLLNTIGTRINAVDPTLSIGPILQTCSIVGSRSKKSPDDDDEMRTSLATQLRKFGFTEELQRSYAWLAHALKTRDSRLQDWCSHQLERWNNESESRSKTPLRYSFRSINPNRIFHSTCDTPCAVATLQNGSGIPFPVKKAVATGSTRPLSGSVVRYFEPAATEPSFIPAVDALRLPLIVVDVISGPPFSGTDPALEPNRSEHAQAGQRVRLPGSGRAQNLKPNSSERAQADLDHSSEHAETDLEPNSGEHAQASVVGGDSKDAKELASSTEPENLPQTWPSTQAGDQTLQCRSLNTGIAPKQTCLMKAKTITSITSRLTSIELHTGSTTNQRASEREADSPSRSRPIPPPARSVRVPTVKAAADTRLVADRASAKLSSLSSAKQQIVSSDVATPIVQTGKPSRTKERERVTPAPPIADFTCRQLNTAASENGLSCRVCILHTQAPLMKFAHNVSFITLQIRTRGIIHSISSWKHLEPDTEISATKIRHSNNLVAIEIDATQIVANNGIELHYCDVP